MSWSLSVPATEKNKFAEAVDAARASGQDGVAGRDEDVSLAKETIKSLSEPLGTGGKRIQATAQGHIPQGAGSYDNRNIGVQVTEAQ